MSETHIGEDGLWIPTDLRDFNSQIVIRTPRATIQHFGSQSLDGYYGMIDETHFGDVAQMRDPKNAELAPDTVTIKPQGEEPVRLTVDTDPQVRTDGGQFTDGTDRFCTQCGWDGETIKPYCPACGSDWRTERVTVDRDVLEELINTAKGDLERLVQADGYREGDDVVDELVETVEAAEQALQSGTDQGGRE